MLDGLFHLPFSTNAPGSRDLLAGLCVQVKRVEIGQNVVLAPRADAHRAGMIVAGQMVRLRFDQAAFTTHPGHHLQRMAFIVLAPDTSAMNTKKSSASRSNPGV